ncbi:unnamed protein product [Closterium sp. NIES-65]|nr:unnamed protein product [Closterium sp. NIES-65]
MAFLSLSPFSFSQASTSVASSPLGTHHASDVGSSAASPRLSSADVAAAGSLAGPAAATSASSASPSPRLLAPPDGLQPSALFAKSRRAKGSHSRSRSLSEPFWFLGQASGLDLKSPSRFRFGPRAFSVSGGGGEGEGEGGTVGAGRPSSTKVVTLLRARMSSSPPPLPPRLLAPRPVRRLLTHPLPLPPDAALRIPPTLSPRRPPTPSPRPPPILSPHPPPTPSPLLPPTHPPRPLPIRSPRRSRTRARPAPPPRSSLPPTLAPRTLFACLILEEPGGARRVEERETADGSADAQRQGAGRKFWGIWGRRKGGETGARGGEGGGEGGMEGGRGAREEGRQGSGGSGYSQTLGRALAKTGSGRALSGSGTGRGRSREGSFKEFLKGRFSPPRVELLPDTCMVDSGVYEPGLLDGRGGVGSGEEDEASLLPLSPTGMPVAALSQQHHYQQHYAQQQQQQQQQQRQKQQEQQSRQSRDNHSRVGCGRAGNSGDTGPGITAFSLPSTPTSRETTSLTGGGGGEAAAAAAAAAAGEGAGVSAKEQAFLSSSLSSLQTRKPWGIIPHTSSADDAAGAVEEEDSIPPLPHLLHHLLHHSTSSPSSGTRGKCPDQEPGGTASNGLAVAGRDATAASAATAAPSATTARLSLPLTPSPGEMDISVDSPAAGLRVSAGASSAQSPLSSNSRHRRAASEARDFLSELGARRPAFMNSVAKCGLRAAQHGRSASVAVLSGVGGRGSVGIEVGVCGGDGGGGDVDRMGVDCDKAGWEKFPRNSSSGGGGRGEKGQRSRLGRHRSSASLEMPHRPFTAESWQHVGEVDQGQSLLSRGRRRGHARPSPARPSSASSSSSSAARAHDSWNAAPLPLSAVPASTHSASAYHASALHYRKKHALSPRSASQAPAPHHRNPPNPFASRPSAAAAASTHESWNSSALPPAFAMSQPFNPPNPFASRPSASASASTHDSWNSSALPSAFAMSQPFPPLALRSPHALPHHTNQSTSRPSASRPSASPSVVSAAASTHDSWNSSALPPAFAMSQPFNPPNPFASRPSASRPSASSSVSVAASTHDSWNSSALPSAFAMSQPFPLRSPHALPHHTNHFPLRSPRFPLPSPRRPSPPSRPPAAAPSLLPVSPHSRFSTSTPPNPPSPHSPPSPTAYNPEGPVPPSLSSRPSTAPHSSPPAGTRDRPARLPGPRLRIHLTEPDSDLGPDSLSRLTPGSASASFAASGAGRSSSGRWNHLQSPRVLPSLPSLLSPHVAASPRIAVNSPRFDRLHALPHAKKSPLPRDLVPDPWDSPDHPSSVDNRAVLPVHSHNVGNYPQQNPGVLPWEGDGGYSAAGSASEEQHSQWEYSRQDERPQTAPDRSLLHRGSRNRFGERLGESARFGGERLRDLEEQEEWGEDCVEEHGERLGERFGEMLGERYGGRLVGHDKYHRRGYNGRWASTGSFQERGGAGLHGREAGGMGGYGGDERRRSSGVSGGGGIGNGGSNAGDSDGEEWSDEDDARAAGGGTERGAAGRGAAGGGGGGGFQAEGGLRGTGLAGRYTAAAGSGTSLLRRHSTSNRRRPAMRSLDEHEEEGGTEVVSIHRRYNEDEDDDGGGDGDGGRRNDRRDELAPLPPWKEGLRGELGSAGQGLVSGMGLGRPMVSRWAGAGGGGGRERGSRGGRDGEWQDMPGVSMSCGSGAVWTGSGFSGARSAAFDAAPAWAPGGALGGAVRGSGVSSAQVRQRPGSASSVRGMSERVEEGIVESLESREKEESDDGGGSVVEFEDESEEEEESEGEEDEEEEEDESDDGEEDEEDEEDE